MTIRNEPASTINTQDREFLIAYKFLQPNESTILSRRTMNPSDEFICGMDVSNYIGRGVWICTAKIIESVQHTDDLTCEIDMEGNSAVFEIEKILDQFPIIEGNIEAGIYQFYQSESEYYEVKNAHALSKLFAEEPNFNYEKEKFVCRSDGIYLYSIEDSKELCFYEKHPLTFYDVYCPICQQKVVTYETRIDSFRCEIIFLPCPNFIGTIIWAFEEYDTEALNDFQINYKLVDGNLYFETAQGWQKPVIHIQPYHPINSYWNDSLESTTASHFFFTETEPKYRNN